MKLLNEQIEELRSLPSRSSIEWSASQEDVPTLRVDGVQFHSRYRPLEEARKLIAGHELEPGRPVVVFGLGLGYHAAELLQRGHTVIIIEPDPEVAAVFSRVSACDLGGAYLWLDSLESLLEDAGFIQLAKDGLQCLAHPPTSRAHATLWDMVKNLPDAAQFIGERLNIAVVGPMYGGSLPITGYLVRALQKMGHRVLQVDNDLGWPVYDTMRNTVKQAGFINQLGGFLTHFLSEWTIARVAEFNPEICIVMAQGPVSPTFPLRLRQLGILTAYWYVENWRHMPYWRDIAPLYDGFFHIQPGEFDKALDEIGCRYHAFVQTGCDPELHRPVTLKANEKKEYECEVSFAGAGYPNRLQFFRGLTDYQFKLWGVEWPSRELAHLVVGGEKRFDSETFMKIVAGTQINLNLHSSATHDGVDPACDAINPRVFEIAAAGGFQVCDPCVGLERHFDFQAELPVYHDLPGLRAIIDHYLSHPAERREIARCARTRALNEHTYAHRAAEMLRWLLLWHASRLREKGIRIQRTVSEIIGKSREEDKELVSWLKTLPQEMLFTHEFVEPLVRPGGLTGLAYPERVFSYLKEVRTFAETMLKELR